MVEARHSFRVDSHGQYAGIDTTMRGEAEGMLYVRGVYQRPRFIQSSAYRVMACQVFSLKGKGEACTELRDSIGPSIVASADAALHSFRTQQFI